MITHVKTNYAYTWELEKSKTMNTDKLLEWQNRKFLF